MEENGGDDQAFQTSLAEPPSPPANASERTRESRVIFVVSLLCAAEHDHSLLTNINYGAEFFHNLFALQK